MVNIKKTPIVRFDTFCRQDAYRLSRLNGFMLGSSMIDLINEFLSDRFSNNKDMDLLDANPRNPKRGSITADIIKSLTDETTLFHFMSKGILIAASAVKALDRNRFELHFEDPQTSGILDGGHNTLAIALYCLECAGATAKQIRSVKQWRDLPSLWNLYFDDIKTIKEDFTFLVPTEIIYPRPNAAGEDDFAGAILQIAEARNNNTQLLQGTKDNKAGYYTQLKEFLDDDLKDRIEWAANDGGLIKSREIVSLALIPLSRTRLGNEINPVTIYASKSQCEKTYKAIIDEPGVLDERSSGDASVKIIDKEILSALSLVRPLPKIYDLLHEKFPDACITAGARPGRWLEVKYKDGNVVGVTRFYGHDVKYGLPDGYIIPLMYALRELLKNDDNGNIAWITDPIKFIEENLNDIMSNFISIIEMANRDPQKVGKNRASYQNACTSFQNVLLRKGLI
jgi:hypothetical protein